MSKKKNQTYYSIPLQYCELATAKRFRPYRNRVKNTDTVGDGVGLGMARFQGIAILGLNITKKSS